MALRQRLKERTEPLVKRVEPAVRDFEWTWTKAAVAALLLWFIGIGSMAILPSWFLYFADQKWGWHPCPCPSAFKFWMFKLRDIIASGLYGTSFLIMIVVPYFLQKWRRRLRSESESRPTGGYR